MLQDEWLDEGRAQEVAGKVREELARRRISRQALADIDTAARDTDTEGAGHPGVLTRVQEHQEDHPGGDRDHNDAENRVDHPAD